MAPLELETSATRKREHRLWTDQEKAELRSLVPTHTFKEIGRLLGRSHRSVSSMAFFLRLNGPTRSKAWTEADLAVLKRNYENCKTTDLAQTLGRPDKAVRSMANHLGLKKSELADSRGKNKKPATLENAKFEPLLRELHPKLSNPQIALLIGKSPSWVMSQYQRLGLTRDPETVRKRRAENFGGDLPPEIRELVDLRRQLVRKLNEQSKNHRNPARASF